MRPVVIVFAGALFAALVSTAAGAQGGDPMAEQRCVWQCLANSPGGAESAAYRVCVARYCSAGPSEPARAAPSARAVVQAPRRSPVPLRRTRGRAPDSELAPGAVEPETARPQAIPPGPAGAPVLPSIAAPMVPVARWENGRTGDGQGMYAAVTDAQTGVRVSWLCAPGRGSFLSIEPYSGTGSIVVVVAERRLSVELHVEGGAGFVPVAFDAPVFLHMASGQRFTVEEADGMPIGTFPMTDAPVAIGQAEGICQAMR